MDGERTYLQGPWHYCGICDIKTKIAHMRWQKGVLRCPRCVDRMLIGSREIKIAAVLGDGKVEFDLASKLKHPDTETDSGDIVISGI